MHSTYLDSIKSFEGFSTKAEWDYAQHSNGYGTKALFPGETITREEAERRFLSEIDAARQIVEKHAQGWDEGTKAALTSLTFNAGTKWINTGLGVAVRAQDIAAVREKFVEYNKAQGQVLPGLVNRRQTELAWIGSPPPAVEASRPAQAEGHAQLASQPTPATPSLQALSALSPDDSAAAASTRLLGWQADSTEVTTQSIARVSLHALLVALFDLQLSAPEQLTTKGSRDDHSRPHRSAIA